MEYEIEDALKEIFEYLTIEVIYKDIRKYLIRTYITTENFRVDRDFIYVYNAKLTFDENINIIANEIDKRILSFYRGINEKE